MIPAMSRSTPCVLSAVLAIAVAACAAGPQPEPAPEIRIHVAGRAIAAGEPVRVTARSSAPLATLEGSFLGNAVALSSADSGSTWTGWAVVPLDRLDAGSAPLELLGRSNSGVEAAAVVELAVLARQFPEERLSVEDRFVEPPPEVADRIERERERTAEIYARRTPSTLDDRAFAPPVPGPPTSEFGKRRVYNGTPKAPHAGIDLRAATGTRVLSAGPGIVALASDLYYAGNTVIVDHGDGLFTVYAHLSKIEAREGARVERGEILGLSGATGRVTGPHLHWGAKIGNVPFDPRALYDAALFRPPT